MDNLGKFLYMAASALLFIFALTASVFLYGTLNNYLELATGLTNVYDRVEGESVEASLKREIPWGEVYITALSMDDMHVSELKIKGSVYTISNEDSYEDIIFKLGKYRETYGSRKILNYEVVGSTITYTVE